MRWSIACVSCITNIAKYVPGVHDGSRLEAAVLIEMRIVVHLSSRPENVDDLSSELVGPNADDYAISCRKYWRAAGGKDVDALM